jgi:ribosomal protein L12E/L44/L45/RPP1/RPP2
MTMKKIVMALGLGAFLASSPLAAFANEPAKKEEAKKEEPKKKVEEKKEEKKEEKN